MMEWNSAQIAQLCELWDDKSLSTAEIGRRMGASKNAVVGKAGRLGLPSRPSPIHFGPPRPPDTPRVQRAPKQTLAPIAPEPPLPPKPVPEHLCEPCCWPIGEPGARSFRYCDEPSVIGRNPYCAEHSKLAYRTPPPRNGGNDADADAARR